MNIARWVDEQRALLELERAADLEESALARASHSEKTLEARGLAIRHLYINETKTGLCGRTLIEFARRDGVALPASEIGAGDIVQVGLDAGGGGKDTVTGIVFRANEARVTVSFDEYPEIDEPLTLVKLANEVTFKRYRQMLDKLARDDGGSRLAPVLFGHTQPSVAAKPAPIEILDAGLNATQVDAVRRALAANDVFLIHGPPGTGKTTAVIEVIRQAVLRGDRVLVCAASNIAVDNVVERLASHKVRVCRTGHPARLLPEVLRHSLDYLVQHHDNAAIVDDIRADMSATLTRLRARGVDRAERVEMRADMKRLRRELSEREEKTTEDVLMRAQVVACTLTGSAARDVFALPPFDLVVIDEAAQALEAACWIALLKGRRCVLAGDHKQLPPTIKSHAASPHLSVTLFDRLATLFRGEHMMMLTTQYRMNAAIMQWSSDELYESRLLAADAVRAHRLCDVAGVRATPDTCVPFVFVDTAGCAMLEAEDAAPEVGAAVSLAHAASKRNEGEADVAAAHVRLLIAAGVSERDIALVTPYNAQVDELRARLAARYPLLEIGSVDGFQGREKEAIVISLVRSNAARTVGFLAEDRRINVAVTRSRRHLCIVGDSSTIGSHAFLARLLAYAQRCADYRSATEYAALLPLPDRDTDIALDECDANEYLAASSAEPGAGAVDPTTSSSAARSSKARLSKAAARKLGKAAAAPLSASAASHSTSATSSTSHAASAAGAGVDDAGDAERVQFAMDVDDALAHLVRRCRIARTAGATASASASAPTCAPAASVRAAMAAAAAKAPHAPSALVAACTATSVDFVATLNSFQRLIVHEVAERVFLEHASTGVAPARFIRVSVPRAIEDALCTLVEEEGEAEAIVAATAAAASDCRAPALDKKKKKKKKPAAAPTVADGIESGDSDIDNDKAESKVVASQAASLSSVVAGVAANGAISSSRHSKPPKAAAAAKASMNDEDDLDALLASMNIRPGQCAFKTCAKPTKMVGVDCPHCHKRFCYEHGMAEIHGCGAEAKRAARAEFREAAATKDVKHLSAAQRAHVQRKLDAKLETMAGARQAKKDDAKKK